VVARAPGGNAGLTPDRVALGFGGERHDKRSQIEGRRVSGGGDLRDRQVRHQDPEDVGHAPSIPTFRELNAQVVISGEHIVDLKRAILLHLQGIGARVFARGQGRWQIFPCAVFLHALKRRRLGIIVEPKMSALPPGDGARGIACRDFSHHTPPVAAHGHHGDLPGLDQDALRVAVAPALVVNLNQPHQPPLAGGNMGHGKAAAFVGRNLVFLKDKLEPAVSA